MSCHTDENPQTTTRRRFQLAACLAVLCITHPASANSPRDALGWLRQQLETLSRAPDLQPGKIAVLVSELTGRTLFAKNAELSVPIASNVKLVTAIAALSELGPAYRFATRVYVDRVVDGVVKGNLYVRGSGDPSLAPQHLWRIARYLKHFGIKRISGRIVLDERLFDDQRLPPLFETRTSDMYYRAATGALSLNENAFAIQVLGGDRAGQAGRVIIEPTTDYITTQVDLQTVGRRARTKLELSTQAERARTLLTIKGQLRPGYRGGWHLRRVEHPALFFGLTLRHELQAQGIRIDNHDPVAGKAPSGEEIYVVHSAPLASLVRYMTKSSSNFVAEQLLKVLGAEKHGAPGTSEKGLRVLRALLKRVGIEAGKYTLANGSGLYEENRFSATQICTLLRQVASDFRYGADLMASLPIAGQDGTLAKRFAGSGVEGYLRAKTGTLNHVVSLSGYAGTTKQRAPLVFSFLLTDFPDGKIAAARRVADQMAQALVTFLER